MLVSRLAPVQQVDPPVSAITSLGASALGVGLAGTGWTSQNRGDVLEQLQPAVEDAAANHVEGDVGIPVVDPVPAAAPVITGKTTTRKRSTRPAFRSERHRVRLPRVRIGLTPLPFISRTASTGSWGISCVFGHDNGSSRAREHDLRQAGQRIRTRARRRWRIRTSADTCSRPSGPCNSPPAGRPARRGTRVLRGPTSRANPGGPVSLQ